MTQTTNLDLLPEPVARVVRDWQELPDPFAMLRDPVPLATALTAAYPQLDFALVSREIVAWWTANPSKRKTRRGVARFLQSWFSREAAKQRVGQQDSPGVSQAGQGGVGRAALGAEIHLVDTSDMDSRSNGYSFETFDQIGVCQGAGLVEEREDDERG